MNRVYRGFLRYCLIKILGQFRRERDRILYVDPRDVAYTISKDDQTLKGNSVWHFGTSKSGDWDLNGYPVREYNHVYKILKRRFEDKIPYNEIPEFVENLQLIERGGSWYHCRSKAAYLKRWERTEKLYGSIKERGYKTRADLGEKDWFDEVRIQVGRKGDLLVEEGFHRLVIAQLLNIEKIPVVVFRRHQEWVKLREDVKKIVLIRGFFHQPFNHPDLDILPQWYGNDLKDQAFYGNERWDYILNSLTVEKGTVLDIGAYFGYFSHRFEGLGFECTAVEIDSNNHAVLKRYREMMGKKFTVWKKDIFDMDRFEYDIVLALNIFHHLVKRKRNYEKLIEFLGRLRCKSMYFEPGNNDRDSYKNFSDEEFVNFVLRNSSLNHSRLLGPTKVGRNLYLLTTR